MSHTHNTRSSKLKSLQLCVCVFFYHVHNGMTNIQVREDEAEIDFVIKMYDDGKVKVIKLSDVMNPVNVGIKCMQEEYK